MGLSPISNSVCKTDSCASVSTSNASTTASRAGNPDPKRFSILRTAEFRNYTVIEVVYPDAKNYEGRKVMVYACSLDRIRTQDELDPHFCDDGSHLSPFARFEPTETGWNAACELAKNLGR